MAEFTLREVLEATRGAALQTGEDFFSSVTTDTRRIERGALFVALRGERFDGHAFVAQAAELGAAGAIVDGAWAAEELVGLGALTVIRVADTLAAYQSLAALHRRRFSIPVIAVTGSNGKTTTKDLTAAVLGARWKVLKTEANYNNEIGLPMTLLQLTDRHEAAVVEMGMRGFGQIAALAEIARPTIGIVTNVGETHLELLGSMENIARAKAELVEAIDAAGTVILSADDPRVRAMAARVKGKAVLFGCGADGDVRAADMARAGRRTKFSCRWHGGAAALQLPMLGRHNVENALAAIACGLELGLSPAEIQSGLDGFTATKMRLQFEKIGAYTVINDAYNASPASMAAAIDTLTEVAAGRSVAVLGDMLELGDAAAAAHRAVGRRLAEKGVAVLIALGPLAAAIAAGAAACGVPQVHHCDSREAAGRRLQSLLAPGDTILFKGSRGMRMEELIAWVQE